MTIPEIQRAVTKDELRLLIGTLLGALYQGEQALEKAACYYDETPSIAMTRRLMQGAREAGWAQLGEVQG